MAKPRARTRAYWDGYTAIQDAKHKVLRGYLGAWYPILGTSSGRVVYVDCHAGKGRHHSGQPGSPLVALETLLSHASRDKILSRCEVRFFFLELYSDHASSLEAEVARLRASFPKKLEAQVITGDYEAWLTDTVRDLRQRGLRLAPSFFFVDPFGFDIPMELMKQLLSFPQSELLINLMVPFIDRALRHKKQEGNMERLFGGGDWRALGGIADTEERYAEICSVYKRMLGSRYRVELEMRGLRGERKYSLIHCTNHPLGCDRMKGVMWKVSGGNVSMRSYLVFEGEGAQRRFFEGDLGPLRREIMREFSGRAVHYEDVKEWLRGITYLVKPLNAVLRELHEKGSLSPSPEDGKLVFKRNPILTFKGDSGA